MKRKLGHYSNKYGSKLLISSICVLLGACQAGNKKLDTLDEIDQALLEGEKIASASVVPGKNATLVPDDISNALIPKMKIDLPVKETNKESERFDITVSNVPADQFFMSLVEGTPINIVVDPDLEGTISLNLKNVTVTDVMNAVRDVYGYEFEETDYGYQILPNRLESRIYQVDYLNVTRSGISSTSVSTGTLQSTGSGSSSSSGSTGSTDSTSSNSGSSSTSSTAGTQVTTQQPETSFWTELETSIKAILGSGEGRSVVVNAQSGLVVVRGTPNELRGVEKYLASSQDVSQRQVIIEAKVLEVELNDGFRSGVNWALLSGSFLPAVTGGGTSVTGDSGFSDISGNNGTLNPDTDTFNPIDNTAASAFGGIFSLAISSNRLSAFIELLQKQGDVQVLSSPRISTMNNQKAVIKVGQDEFFVTKVSSDSVTGTSTNTTSDIELTPFFSGIALDVTPQISRDNYVTLHIHPSVSRVQEQVKEVETNGKTERLPLARSTIRESDSVIRAKNGNIVVIGGLMQDTIDNSEAKAPGVGDVPIFGNLFKQKSNSSSKSELIILLRPIVVEDQRQWGEAIRNSRKNVERIREALTRQN